MSHPAPGPLHVLDFTKSKYIKLITNISRLITMFQLQDGTILHIKLITNISRLITMFPLEDGTILLYFCLLYNHLNSWDIFHPRSTDILWWFMTLYLYTLNLNDVTFKYVFIVSVLTIKVRHRHQGILHLVYEY